MKKRIVDVEVTSQAYPNISEGVCEEIDKPIVFKGGILGQTCKVRVKRNMGDKKKGDFIEVVNHSPLENERNYCPHADICGGCAYQRLPYESELLLKRKMILKLLEEGGFHDLDEVKINRSPKITDFRNKMEYTFGDSTKGGPLVLGLHRQGFFYEIVDNDECQIVDHDFNLLRAFTQNYFRKKGYSFYHKTSHLGLLRNFIVRKALSTGEIMIILVTTSDPGFGKEEVEDFKEKILTAGVEGEIVSIFHCTNDSLADAVVPEKMDLLYGEGFIKENLLGLSFKISPFSFFQPNIYTAEKLYTRALEYAEINENTKILDLYSGTGTITQIMAQGGGKALGIEIVEEAVEKARENARLNFITNASFIAGDVLEEIKKIRGDYDLVVLDPPREGINPKAIEDIISIDPEKFIYISCNPKTQVRDMKIFRERGYELKKYEIFDQFPRSRHCEAIALMSKLDK